MRPVPTHVGGSATRDACRVRGVVHGYISSYDSETAAPIVLIFGRHVIGNLFGAVSMIRHIWGATARAHVHTHTHAAFVSQERLGRLLSFFDSWLEGQRLLGFSPNMGRGLFFTCARAHPCSVSREPPVRLCRNFV